MVWTRKLEWKREVPGIVSAEMKRLDRLLQEYGIVDELDEDGQPMNPSQLIQTCLVNARLVINDGLPQQVPGHSHLFIGSIGAAYNKKNLEDVGISHVLCLTALARLKFAETIVYKRIPIRDVPEANLTAILPEAIAFINESLEFNGRVLVHCYQGVSRSAAVVCAYLMLTNNYCLLEAMERVRTARPQVAPNSGFLLQLRHLERANPRSTQSTAS